MRIVYPVYQIQNDGDCGEGEDGSSEIRVSGPSLIPPGCSRLHDTSSPTGQGRGEGEIL